MTLHLKLLALLTRKAIAYPVKKNDGE